MTLKLGTGSTGSAVYLSDLDRSTHVHVVGSSGSGKSKLLEHLIRQDILAGRGLCLIDPHGTLADSVLAWCGSRRLDGHRKIHILNPSDGDFTTGFNPLGLDGTTEPAVRVDAMVEACSQVWGGEDTNRTPLLKKCLRAVFYALAVRGLSLVEAVELVGSGDVRLVRRRLTENLPDYVFASVWEEFNHLSKADFAEQFSSTNNRLLEFLNSPVVRRIVGQTSSPLNLRTIMDQGDILIVNLALKGQLSEANARLLGTLLTSEFFLCAVGRDEATARRRPFSLYIDECYDYLTEKTESILDQTRKFGLHAVLSHQRLSQLRRRSEHIYNGVMAGAQTKIVFRLPHDDDAEIMARHLYRSTFNLERPKHVLDKPIVVGEEIGWLSSESTTRTDTAHSSYSDGYASSDGHGQSEAASFGPDGRWSDQTGGSVVENQSRIAGRSETLSTGSSSGFSHTETSVQTLFPIRQIMPTAVYSLDEELHRAIVAVREQPARMAVLKRPGQPPVPFRTADMRDPLTSKARTARFVAGAKEASEYVKPIGVADREIELRLASVRNQKAPAPSSEDFWV